MLKCPICNQEFKKISNSHLKKHNITIDEFRKMFPNFNMTSDETRNKLSNGASERAKRGWETFKKNGNIEERIKSMTRNNGSKERRLSISKKMKENWKDDDFRDKNAKGQMHSNNYLNTIKSDTGIERKIKQQLELNSIKYKQQKHIYSKELKIRVVADFYLPEINLIIECNGDYWHCNPDIYEKPINEVQEKMIRKDKIKCELYDFLDFKYLILWETDINKDDFNILTYLEGYNGI